jgi:hypothetical protein
MYAAPTIEVQVPATQQLTVDGGYVEFDAASSDGVAHETVEDVAMFDRICAP